MTYNTQYLKTILYFEFRVISFGIKSVVVNICCQFYKCISTKMYINFITFKFVLLDYGLILFCFKKINDDATIEQN